MNNRPKRPPQLNQDRQQPPQKTSFIWRFLIWFIIIWAVWTYFFQDDFGKNAVDLTYTKFKQEVKQGDIAKVTMKEQDISGTFKKKYRVSGDSEQDTTSYKYFTTTRPSVEDPELLKILETNNVIIDAESGDNSWLRMILIIFLPWLLIIGIFVYANRKMRGRMKNMMGGGGIFGFGKSRAKKYHKSESTDTTFDDVAGLENAKKDLQEIIEYLKDPEKFTSLGADIPKGILMVGPPGTGKTLLSRATAGEADVPFFSISGSEFIEMFVGVGASRVRDMFNSAKKEAPSIIFIDEIDSIGRARGTGLGGGHDEREQTLNQILAEMDGFEPHESVVVMAATNRPDVLDPALTRPGRFDRHVTLSLPFKNAREAILKIHTKKVPLADDVDLESLAARTVGFSGADLKNLVNEAALLAGRKDKKKVNWEDFDQARDKVMLGTKREDVMDDEDKKIVAYHEAGHAMLAKLLPNTDPLQKVTIIPRGRALGVTEQIQENEQHNPGRGYLVNRMTIMLGGRASEKLVFDEITTGAANDLKQVTQLARRMVCQWGMSDKLGPVTFRQGEDHMFLGREIAQPRDFSEYTAKVIDEEIQRIVRECEEKAISTLKKERKKLEALAEALFEHETLDKEEVEKILEKDSSSKKKKDEKQDQEEEKKTEEETETS